jgi:hypothetical protein
MNDDDLTTLLGLADGDRPLPPGVEDRLLAGVLATASQPRGTATPPTREVHPVPTVPTPRRWWVTPAVAAAAIAMVLAIGLSVPRPELGVGPTDRPPSEIEPVAPASLTGPELCAELEDGLVDTGLVGRAVIVSNIAPDAMERVAALTTELTSRLRDDDPATARDLDDAVARFETVALALRDTTDRADAAHARARTAVSETSLFELAGTCPIAGSP